VLDASRGYLTAYLAPDREAIISHAAVATNHQERVEWSSHARFTATVERERFLLQRLTLHVEPQERFIGAFLRPPLYSTAFDAGFGTLYTAAYRPAAGALDLHWPGTAWPHCLDAFKDGSRRILTPPAA
jgi:predicted choloylglycine hydrolase